MTEINPSAATEMFIKEHAADNVHTLALLASRYPDVDIHFALFQIDGRQRAKIKLPTWSSIDGIYYPVHLSMEQCSSQQTAEYKYSLAKNLIDDNKKSISKSTSFVDLTGGFGVDFSFISRAFGHSVYVERQNTLCEIAKHNFNLLHLSQSEVVCGDGVEYLSNVNDADLFFIDPARRDSNGSKVVAISDCTPDVIQIKKLLLDKARYTLIKLSPMLDWHKAVDDLNKDSQCVSQLHIVSVDNECKELLFVITKECTGNLQIYCVNDDSNFDFTYDQNINQLSTLELSELNNIEKDNLYVYEPNASIMKSGCFGILENRYPVKAIGKNSHLYISSHNVDEFPGRKFVMDKVTTMNKKDLKKNLSEIEKANITVRNFNMSVDELRKRLKIKDGGDKYIFATTIADKQHVLLICHKA
ncbi:MAG TPA: SAM-dependent methyltransferase [Xylanibacter oryzae]|nr:SAM-dependent methyltransferase [Xylanibacter oryzae]